MMTLFLMKAIAVDEKLKVLKKGKAALNLIYEKRSESQMAKAEADKSCLKLKMLCGNVDVE